MGHSVTVIGIGPGSEDYLTPRAIQAVRGADILVGGSRALALFANLNKSTRLIDRQLESIVDFIAKNRLEQRIAVLVSGDPGFFSLLPMLSREIGSEHLEVIPGLSSLQMAFARLRLPWQEARWKSMHGRPMEEATEELSHEGWVAFLTDPHHSPEAIADCLTVKGEGWRHGHITRNLGYDDETVVSGTLAALASERMEPYQPSLLIVQGGSNPILTVQSPTEDDFPIGLADNQYVRDKVPMTKSDIRALTLVRARITPKDVVWDVGAGTGSISVEAARMARNGYVYAVERNPAGCKLIELNANRFGLSNLHIVSGEAPAALRDLPEPNVVVVGGSGGNLQEILHFVWSRLKAKGRLVINAITVETLSAATAWFQSRGLAFEAAQIQVQRLENIGQYHLWKSQNPVVILWAQKEET